MPMRSSTYRKLCGECLTFRFARLLVVPERVSPKCRKRPGASISAPRRTDALIGTRQMVFGKNSIEKQFLMALKSVMEFLPVAVGLRDWTQR